MAKDYTVPEVFDNYINNISLDNIEIVKLKDVNLITQEEALEDLRVFKHIIDNAYSGREYWENNGIDFKKAYKKIGDYLVAHDAIPMEVMFDLYCESLQGIQDGHLRIMTFNKSKKMHKQYKTYFADVLLEKSNERFKVIISKAAALAIGDIFSLHQLKGKIYRTLSPYGCEHFLLGCRSWDEITQLSINSGDSVITVPVHPCRASENMNGDVGVFNKSFEDGFHIVTSSRFSGWDERIAEDFFNCGLSLRNESTVIWDIRNNGGGNSNYPWKFIKGLNEYSYCKRDCAILSSPSISQAKGIEEEKIQKKREWTFSLSKERDVSKGVFNGTLYVLINDRVGSSAELAINIARSVKNCVTVGQNSNGVGVFGDQLAYRLPFSDIVMQVPYKLFLQGANEGEGFEPDYWVNNTDVKGELLYWLNDPEGYRALR